MIGAEVRCFMPLALKKSSISLLTKYVPLSVTTISRSPNRAITPRNASMTTEDVALLTQKASIHLLCTSIMIKNILFSNGPAKSKCNRVNGLEGHCHVLNGAGEGVGCKS